MNKFIELAAAVLWELLRVSEAYEKQIPFGNDSKKGKGAAAINSIDL